VDIVKEGLAQQLLVLCRDRALDRGGQVDESEVAISHQRPEAVYWFIGSVAWLRFVWLLWLRLLLLLLLLLLLPLLVSIVRRAVWMCLVHGAAYCEDGCDGREEGEARSRTVRNSATAQRTKKDSGDFTYEGHVDISRACTCLVDYEYFYFLHPF